MSVRQAESEEKISPWPLNLQRSYALVECGVCLNIFRPFRCPAKSAILYSRGGYRRVLGARRHSFRVNVDRSWFSQNL